MFVRNENFYTFRRNYPIVTILIAIHIILYAFTFLGNLGIFPPGQWLYVLGVGWNVAIAAGEWWRLITPVFLHVDLFHMLFNSFALFLFGPPIEKMVGKYRFVLFYLLTAVIANIVTFYLQPLGYRHVGASGAIYGLLGMYVYMMIFRKELIDAASRQIVTVMVVIGIIMTFLNPRINILAHIIGLVAGMAIAAPFLRKAKNFFSIPRYAPTRYREENDGIGFDPNRWNKKRRMPFKSKTIYNILGIGFVILIVIGLLSSIFSF
ncbi:rhomboid family intramembrane serine protease [Geomicrobium sp. JSM 1781026]|uniref:rhomboid family intramembrane serine protease n=1 Tax=Geomicrobium sp. JSM 1781026 TaxID=3344580 RepID=UPI0035C122F8